MLQHVSAAVTHTRVKIQSLFPILRKVVALHDAKHVNFWHVVLAGEIAGHMLVQSCVQQISVTFIRIMTTLQHMQRHIAIFVAAHMEEGVFVLLCLYVCVMCMSCLAQCRRVGHSILFYRAALYRATDSREEKKETPSCEG